LHKSNFHARLLKLLCPDLHWSIPLDEHFLKVIKTLEMFDDVQDGGQQNYYKELIEETRQAFDAERFG